MSLLDSATSPTPGISYFALAGSQVQVPGPQGPPGNTGAQGVPGPPGNSILSDVVPPTPAVGNVSDLFVDLVTSQLYKKTDPVTWVPEFGLIGATGTPATAAVGLTVTVAAGQPANVTNTGPTPSDAIFNFAIPAGTAATVAAGPVTTLAPGAPATVTNTGSTSAAVFAFGIPQGQPGSSSEATWSNYPAISNVDVSGYAITNTTLIDAPAGLTLTANNGPLIIQQKTVGDAIRMEGDVDLSDNDIDNVGSFTAAGVTESVTFGSALAPMLNHSVYATNVNINSYNPISSMMLQGAGGITLNALDDININAPDVNISCSGATNIMNLTAVGGIVLGAGAAIDLTAGGAVAINAVGTLQIVSTGNISIGSGNVLGADCEVEKFSFNDNTMYRNGSADLIMEDVKKISNSGNGSNTLTIEASDAPLTLQGTQTNLTSLSNGDIVIAPQGSGQTRVGTGSLVDVIVVDPIGKTTFSVVPATAAPPVLGGDLTNRTYVDAGLGGKIANDQNVSLLYNLAMPIANSASFGPFFYIPASVGPPTGVPTAVVGCVPLYVDTTGGGADLYAYVAGAWVAV